MMIAITKKKIILIILAVLLIFYSLLIYKKFYIKVTESQAFTEIYKKNRWGIGSGPGSYEENTKVYRELLQNYFDDNRFKTIVDFGCGDFQIMKFINIPDDKTYVGIDIVPEIIDFNIKRYGKSNIRFQVTDDSELKGDLLIVKDVFIHWPNSKIQHFIDTILPNFKYALITNDIAENMYNKDIEYRRVIDGGFRPLDLKKPPFNLKNITIVKEYGCEKTGGKKRVYLFHNQGLNRFDR